MIDCATDRTNEMADLPENKAKHKIVFSNNKVFAIGGYSDSKMNEKLTSVFKYDIELNRWFNCNSMKFGHAGDSFLALGN